MKLESPSVTLTYLMALLLVVIGSGAQLFNAMVHFSPEFLSNSLWWISHFPGLFLSLLVLICLIVRMYQIWSLGGLPLVFPTNSFELTIRRIALILIGLAVVSSVGGYAIAFFSGLGGSILLSAKTSPSMIALLFMFELTRNFITAPPRGGW